MAISQRNLAGREGERDRDETRPLDILQKRPRFLLQSFREYGHHFGSHRQKFSAEQTH